MGATRRLGGRGRAGTGAAYHGPVDLLEREVLLARLADLLTAVRSGRGRIAMIAGEAGVGKTALVEAFCAWAAGQLPVHWGACDPVQPPRAFAPLADIADRASEPLRAALATADRDRVFESFLGVVRRPAGPMIVVLEDLHWADEATLDLLRVVGRRLRDLPVLVIGTCRDEDIADDHPLRLALGDVHPGDVVGLRVPSLSPAAVDRLAAGSGIPDDVLYRATAGNPFFVTEVLASPGDSVPVTVRDAVAVRVSSRPVSRRVTYRITSKPSPSGWAPLLTKPSRT